MKKVVWIDKMGYKRVSLIRDEDPDEMAEMGIPVGPPEVLGELDWQSLGRDLNNLLVERGVLEWKDVVEQQNSVVSAIMTVFKRPVVGAYKSARDNYTRSE